MKCTNKHQNLGKKIDYLLKFLSAVTVPNFVIIYYIYITQLHSQGMSFVRKAGYTAFTAPRGATAPAQQKPLGVWRSTALELWITLTAAFNTLRKQMVEVRDSIKAFIPNRLGKFSEFVPPAVKKGAKELPCLEKLAWLYLRVPSVPCLWAQIPGGITC